MSPQEFVARHEVQWTRLENLLGRLIKESRNKKTPSATEDSSIVTELPADQSQPHFSEFPGLYRQACHHLALARDRHYPAGVVERLNQLVLSGHQVFYAAHAGLWTNMVRFIAADFPALVRQHVRFFWLAALLLYVPILVMGIAVYLVPEMAYTLISPGDAVEMEAMYRPTVEHIGRVRGSDSDVLMFGHYIRNNIGIGFQTFAGGIMFGLGSVFYLVFNGLYMGTIAGHLTQFGYTDTFYSFVVGHGAFELNAIVLSGMAGLKLGWALLAPGQRTRQQALLHAAGISVRIMYGVVVMLLIAAFIEAFWSSSTLVPAYIKYIVGGVFWCLVAFYFTAMGKQRAD